MITVEVVGGKGSENVYYGLVIESVLKTVVPFNEVVRVIVTADGVSVVLGKLSKDPLFVSKIIEELYKMVEKGEITFEEFSNTFIE